MRTLFSAFACLAVAVNCTLSANVRILVQSGDPMPSYDNQFESFGEMALFAGGVAFSGWSETSEGNSDSGFFWADYDGTVSLLEDFTTGYIYDVLPGQENDGWLYATVFPADDDPFLAKYDTDGERIDLISLNSLGDTYGAYPWEPLMSDDFVVIPVGAETLQTIGVWDGDELYSIVQSGDGIPIGTIDYLYLDIAARYGRVAFRAELEESSEGLSLFEHDIYTDTTSVVVRAGVTEGPMGIISGVAGTPSYTDDGRIIFMGYSGEDAAIYSWSYGEISVVLSDIVYPGTETDAYYMGVYPRGGRLFLDLMTSNESARGLFELHTIDGFNLVRIVEEGEELMSEGPIVEYYGVDPFGLNAWQQAFQVTSYDLDENMVQYIALNGEPRVEHPMFDYFEEAMEYGENWYYADFMGYVHAPVEYWPWMWSNYTGDWFYMYGEGPRHNEDGTATFWSWSYATWGVTTFDLWPYWFDYGIQSWRYQDLEETF